MRKALSFIKEVAGITLFHNGVIAGIVNTLFFSLFFLTFQQGDLLLTAGPTLSILNGHVLDFYDYVYPVWGRMVYLPSTYFVFTLWNLPLKLLGIMPPPDQFRPPFVYIMYYKLALAAAYFLSAWIIFKILKQVDFSDKRARFGAFLWFTTPVAMFSSFIFGQYDIFTLLFVLAGIYFYLKDKDGWFVFFFAIALTFKYYSLLVFFPLLLLKEKRIYVILKYALLYFLPVVITILPFLGSEAFRNNVFGFVAPTFVLLARLDLGAYSLQLFILLWVVFAAWAYFTDAAGKQDLFKWMNFFTSLVMFLLFGLSFFHPQWLLFATPFWAMSTLYSRRFNAFLLLDIIIVALLTLITVNIGIKSFDQHIMNLGIFHRISAPVLGNSITMRDLFPLQDTSILFSVLSGAILIQALFKHPKYTQDSFSEQTPPVWQTQLRYIGGVSIYVVPAFFVLVYSIMTPSFSFTRKNAESQPTFPLYAGEMLSQKFVSSFEQMNKFELEIGTEDRFVNSQFHVDIFDDQGQTLFSNTYKTSDFPNTQYKSFCLPNIPVTPGKMYEIQFTASGTSPEHHVNIYRTVDQIDTLNDYAVHNGAPQPYDLAIRVVGSNGFMKPLGKIIPCKR